MTAHEAAVQAYPSHDAITKMDKKTIQMFRDIFIKGWQAREKEGTIVWHSIAEGHVPHIPDGENYIDHLLLYHDELKICTKGAYWFAETGFWRHNTGNWQPTHWAYINYPEPENSVKVQSS